MYIIHTLESSITVSLGKAGGQEKCGLDLKIYILCRSIEKVIPQYHTMWEKG